MELYNYQIPTAQDMLKELENKQPLPEDATADRQLRGLRKERLLALIIFQLNCYKQEEIICIGCCIQFAVKH